MLAKERRNAKEVEFLFLHPEKSVGCSGYQPEAWIAAIWLAAEMDGRIVRERRHASNQ